MNLVTVLGANQVDIEDEEENVIASFVIFRDDHGWRWTLRYTDGRESRVGRL